MPPKSISYSISHALDGLVHCLRTQKHMRLHFTLAFLVMLTAVVLQVAGTQLLILLFSLTMILVAEMINTAVEVVVDLISPYYDSRARIIKDVAAGAVLLSAMGAAIIFLLVFLHSPVIDGLRRYHSVPAYPGNWTELCVEALLILAVVLAVWRLRGAHDRGTRGGPVSARSAFAFFAMALIVLVRNEQVNLIAALIMVLLIVQGGSGTRTYTVRQVALGAVLGIIVPVLVLAAHFAVARPQNPLNSLRAEWTAGSSGGSGYSDKITPAPRPLSQPASAAGRQELRSKLRLELHP